LNETALVIDTAVSLTHNLPRTEVKKSIKYENLDLELKNIWKLNNVSVYPFAITAKGLVTKNYLKYLWNMV
jgi:hypothetical protein